MFQDRNKRVKSKRNEADDIKNTVWPENVLDGARRREECTEKDSSLKSSIGTWKHSLDSLNTLQFVKGMVWEDGDMPSFYSGYVNEANQPHGRGVSTMQNGHIFAGEWSNGKKCNGKYGWRGGDRYEGDFLNDRFHGVGTYTYAADGSCYTGDWVNGKYHGQGTFKDITNEIQYSGEFRWNKRHGYGTLADLEGTILWEGDWKDNEAVKPKD